ncbi:MAG: N-formylglutamate amidohydrolase [Peptococcaceae bacterium]|nr:N-formylglutamate amidohydrolase [Peptococcaceae bacterium]
MESLLRKRGKIPLVISVPHGGMEEPENLFFRGSGNRRADMLTLDLAAGLAGSLETAWGRPYLVAGLIRRSIIDYNRPPEEAYEDPEAARHYLIFHRALEESVGECLEKHGACLLLDIHGCRGAGPGAPHVFLGTGKCAAMSPSAVRLLTDLIAGEGWRVSHDTGGPYRGGFIIRHYASGDGVMGVQLEVSREVRLEPVLRTRFSSSLARSLAAFGRMQLSGNVKLSPT